MRKPRKSHIRNAEQRSLDRYLEEIGQIALLTPKQEKELGYRIRQGDQQALGQLTKANLRFVVSVAKDYQHMGLSLSDLINEGNLGLIRAAKRFDERKGYRFISYAVWWIRQAMQQALAEQVRVVPLPMSRINALRRIQKKSAELQNSRGGEPTVEDLAEALDISREEVSETLRLSGRSLSLDMPIGHDDNASLMDIIKDDSQTPPDEQVLEDSLQNELRRAVDSLKDREAEIIRLYYGLDQERSYTLEEIGHRFGLTRERVRQIKERALQRLRYAPRTRRLRSFVV